MARVQTLVTGLTTTGSRVDRGRDTDVVPEKTPALRVAMGPDTAVDPWAQALLDWDLQVAVTGYVHSAATNVETLMNQIRKEVHIALCADHTLGLAFVLAIVPLGAVPGRAGEMAKPAGTITLNFGVRYRTSRTDPSA